ncbi:hypothetical protein C8J57DRAFT_1595210, partial [Mycena rebaudengoi]
IARLQESIARLNNHRTRISAYIDACNMTLSPFRRMPLDIVQKIFLSCLPTDRNAVMSEAPILLGRICSAWRT